MTWIGAALTAVAGAVALLVISFGGRPAGDDDLGLVSKRWRAGRRLDSR
jgi:hypothetical protein